MKKRLHTSDYTRMALMAALISVSGYLILPLPFSPVPVTAQSLAIMLAGSLLAPYQAFISVGLFILLGTIGLPVFAGGASGPGVMVGPTGGYLFGFLLGAIIISHLRGSHPGFFRFALANLAGGVIAVYLIGVPWLSQITNLSLQQAFMVGGLPFLAGDLTKVAIAAGLAWKLEPQLKRAVYR